MPAVCMNENFIGKPEKIFDIDISSVFTLVAFDFESVKSINVTEENLNSNYV